MSIFILLIDGKLQPEAFTSLSGLCKMYGLSYTSASKGRLVWLENGKKMEICNCTVNKIAGRGRNFNS